MEGELELYITKKVQDLIESDAALFIVEVKVRPTNNIKVYVDGDQGVGIDQLVQFNRKLYKQIEEDGLFPNGDFSLELSSPGLDEPLKLHRQYLKNKGRYVEILQKDGVKTEGKLVDANEAEVKIEEEKGHGKKKELLLHNIPFENIKTTKIQIRF